MNPIRVLIADDHAIVRESIQAVLKPESDIVVCAVAEDGRCAVRLTAQHKPQVVLMDIAMPGLNGVEATRQILRDNSAAKVIILSAHGEQAYVLRAIKAGALGYLLKHASGEFLARAIREVSKGNAYFSPNVAKEIAACSLDFIGGRPGASSLAALSARECEVMQLIAEGRLTKQIADELGVSAKTVEKHRQRLMSKLDIHNIAGLTRYAVLNGVVEHGRIPAHEAAT
ncbi:MAG TPA: response regulator transcription factor [Opitutaceae bacterium]|nr:response regulator transcription factor [Opitutaceae bacterium]